MHASSRRGCPTLRDWAPRRSGVYIDPLRERDGPRASRLGGASLGDLFCKIPNGQALDTVTRCHELGVQYYDTAPWYGRTRSERRLGLAELQAHIRRRHPGHVQTARVAAATTALRAWLEENESKLVGLSDDGAHGDGEDGTSTATAACDAAFPTEDAWSDQILRAVARDNALEDAMDCLDEARPRLHWFPYDRVGAVHADP